jgi:hypothetical protein
LHAMDGIEQQKERYRDRGGLHSFGIFFGTFVTPSEPCARALSLRRPSLRYLRWELARTRQFSVLWMPFFCGRFHMNLPPG